MKELRAKQIGLVLTIAKNSQQGMGLDEIAFITLMRICRDYVDPGRYPFVPDREKWFIDRLNKFRIRFFEKI